MRQFGTDHNCLVLINCQNLCTSQGRIQDFKLRGGAHLKKLRRADGGGKNLEYFVWKITILRQKNHIFSDFRGGARRVRPPLDPPLLLCRLKNTVGARHPLQNYTFLSFLSKSPASGSQNVLFQLSLFSVLLFYILFNLFSFRTWMKYFPLYTFTNQSLTYIVYCH